MPQMRLDKLLSDMGIASRKELRDIIRSGRVQVDGSVAARPETKVDPERSELRLDGEPLRYQKYHYFMLDKPVGVVTATEDRQQQTVLDLLPPEMRRMGAFAVGRLDNETSVFLLLTDGGEWAHRLRAPKACIKKRYSAEVEGEVDAEDADAFSRGILLADGTQCLPAELENLGDGRCIVTVMEGKYHQVRRMLASRGKPVLTLRRLSIGGLILGDALGPGGWRELDEKDLCTLFNG